MSPADLARAYAHDIGIVAAIGFFAGTVFMLLVWFVLRMIGVV